MDPGDGAADRPLIIRFQQCYKAAGRDLRPERGTDMPYVDERSRTMKILFIVLTVLVVGGAIYWAMAASS